MKLESEQAIPWLLNALETAATQEEQVQHAKTLARVSDGWTAETAGRVIAWLDRARGMPGGRLVETAWQQLHDDFRQVWPAEVLTAQATAWAALDRDWSDQRVQAGPPRPFVRNWTVGDLMADGAVDESSLAHRNPATGMQTLTAAGCLACHRYGSRGTHTGPDLTHVGRRYDPRALLESILEPSRQIDPKYALATLLLDDGTLVTGRAVGVSSRELTIETDPLSGKTVVVDRSRIEQSLPTARSPMPEGLLNSFTANEILDLLDLLRQSADQTAP